VDKETIALIIAQNGLGTAATLLNAKAARLKKQWDRARDDAARAVIQKQITKTQKLAVALKIANDGIAQYQVETAE
jgi:hypothetical protein